jgi:hypothetical protein
MTGDRPLGEEPYRKTHGVRHIRRSYRMKSMRAGWLLLVAGAAFCQTAADVPAFEVASVKQAAPITGNRIMVRMGGDPSRVDYANVSLKDVVARACGIKRREGINLNVNYQWMHNRNATVQSFYRGRTKAFETPPMMVTEALTNRLKTVPLKFSIALANLPAGKYDCQVTVLDPNGGKASFWQAPVLLAQ